MQIEIKKLRKKIPIKLLKKTSIRIEKNGTKTETIKELSKDKD